MIVRKFVFHIEKYEGLFNGIIMLQSTRMQSKYFIHVVLTEISMVVPSLIKDHESY